MPPTRSLRERLIECFRDVFPQIPGDAIPHASVETLPAWDSLATVTVLALIEEEFGVRVEPESIEGLTSFDRVLAYLTARPSV